MPDTPANQDAYPQLSSQKPGLGFPLCRLVAVLCLSSGALLGSAISPMKGKGNDEQSLLRSLLDKLERGDVLLGDAYYATYFLYCSLQDMGVDAVFEQQGSRRLNTDFRKGTRLGARDHLITLAKPKKCPHWMSLEDFEQAPESVVIRELYAGGKILVTTMLCPKKTSKEAIKALYLQRWHVELDLRNIKATLGMGVLSCKTPEMIHKEIAVYLLAYNLLRYLMLQAALLANIQPRQLSFKHTLQVWLVWQQHSGNRHDQELLLLIANKRVGNRPGRVEPRAVKRRPKPYPLLTQTRRSLQEEISKNGHPKKLK
jgi:hypothetical protein